MISLGISKIQNVYCAVGLRSVNQVTFGAFGVPPPFVHNPPAIVIDYPSRGRFDIWPPAFATVAKLKTVDALAPLFPVVRPSAVLGFFENEIFP